MLRTILIYGVTAGLIVGIPLSIIVITMGHGPWMSMGMVIGYTLMLVALSTIFMGVKQQRDLAGGGVIRFWPALGMGLGISAVAGVVYVVCWDAACAIAHLDFATGYANAMLAEQRAKGVSGAKLAAVMAEMDAFKARYANPLYRWPMTFAEIFPIGVLVSLASAALLRNPRFMAAPRG